MRDFFFAIKEELNIAFEWKGLPFHSSKENKRITETLLVQSGLAEDPIAFNNLQPSVKDMSSGIRIVIYSFKLNLSAIWQNNEMVSRIKFGHRKRHSAILQDIQNS